MSSHVHGIGEVTATQSVTEDPFGYDGPPDQFLARFLASQRAAGLSLGGALLRPEREGVVEVLALDPSPTSGGGSRPAWLTSATQGVATVMAEGQARVLPFQDTGGMYLTGPSGYLGLLPLRGEGPVRGVAAYLLDETTQHGAELAVRRLELTCASLGLYELKRTFERKQADLELMGGAVSLLASVSEHDRFKAAAMAACNELAQRTKAMRVSFGVLRGRYMRVLAMSQTEQLNRKMRLIQDIESAMEECLDQDLEILHPAPDNADFVSRATADLAERHGPSRILTIPMRLDGVPEAVMLIELPTDQGLTARQVEALRLTSDLLAPALIRQSRQDRWFGARFAAFCKRHAGEIVGPRHTWAKLTAIALLIVLLVSVLYPARYRVEGTFVIKASERQIVAAPFGGYLAEVHVEPGDNVVAGQTVLATLDTADLTLELASLLAEIESYRKDEAMARRDGDIAGQQIAQARRDEAQAQADLIAYRIEQAVIRARVDGVLVEGDLKRQIGVALELGQPMFEVAPLDTLYAELSVPETRVTEVEVGQTGLLASVARPGTYLPFAVDRIDPAAEVVEGQNVFKVRLSFDEQPAELQPGMQGVGKVDVGRRPLMYIWTRDAIRWLRMQLWI
ncbi:efflux RND transporter periplasmic adaptor subunit [Mucisphaera calidilacus]|uniref:Multidrug resistance protein MdtN n=1 Tax=Mucisphaera calidilacus TaxID=2527982 RepID=A0A518BTR8_9BACT|nr:HlyD family efflux transporter periplasmic adaptor subunit [Mucisphaera calidilacus]QDU70370.1 multidrug resistance protein MdtN [Mucisphaera calidilacus]